MSTCREPLPGKYAVTAISIPSVLLYFLTLVLGVVLLALSPLGGEMINSYSIQHLEFFFLFFRILLTLNLFIPTTLALAVYVACFAVALHGNGGYLNWLRRLRTTKADRVPNWLLIMPLITSTLLIIVYVITWLQEILGIPTGDLTPQPSHILFSALTTSPISEELGFRITAIGSIVALRMIFWMVFRGSSGRGLAYAFLSPEIAKKRAGFYRVGSVGLRHGIHWSEWIMLGLSSLVFGYAHVAAGSGWGIGKVTTAAIAGFVMGLAFLIYGAHAAILIHWFFNYYTQVSSIGTQAFDQSTQAYQIFAFLNNLISGWTVLVGLLGFILLACVLLWSRPRSSGQVGTNCLSL